MCDEHNVATLESEGVGPTGRWHLPCGSLRICGVPPTSGDPIPPLKPAKIKSVGPVSDVFTLNPTGDTFQGASVLDDNLTVSR